MSVGRVLAGWKERGVRNVRFELPDMHGTARSKIVPIEHAAHYSKDGLNMYGGAAVLDSQVGRRARDALQRRGRVRGSAAPTGCLDWRRRARGWRPRRDSSATRRGLTVRPLAASPRYVFESVLERARELGYRALMGTETEFYLLDPETHKPLFTRLPHLQLGSEHVGAGDRADRRPDARVRHRHHHRELRVRGFAVGDQLHARKGHGRAGPSLQLQERGEGDREAEGLLASFMSKPFARLSWLRLAHAYGLLRLDCGKNAMADDGAEHGLSRVGRQFVAGQLRTPPRPTRCWRRPSTASSAAAPHVQPHERLVGPGGPQRPGSGERRLA